LLAGLLLLWQCPGAKGIAGQVSRCDVRGLDAKTAQAGEGRPGTLHGALAEVRIGLGWVTRSAVGGRNSAQALAIENFDWDFDFARTARRTSQQPLIDELRGA
jgi:hypothetical protein